MLRNTFCITNRNYKTSFKEYISEIKFKKAPTNYNVVWHVETITLLHQYFLDNK